ncbi:hypothetical protein HZS_4020 [Henneguya salminicola]|nr:hypothetical protein HZS_4020 [Henneguya salminicola]
MKNIKHLKFHQEIIIGYLRAPSTKVQFTIEIQPHNSTIAGRLFLQRSKAGNIDGEFQRFLMWSSEKGFGDFADGKRTVHRCDFSCGSSSICPVSDCYEL